MAACTATAVVIPADVDVDAAADSLRQIGIVETDEDVDDRISQVQDHKIQELSSRSTSPPPSRSMLCSPLAHTAMLGPVPMDTSGNSGSHSHPFFDSADMDNPVHASLCNTDPVMSDELCLDRPRSPSHISSTVSDVSTLGEEDELMITKLAEIEATEKYDINTSSKIIEIWKLFSELKVHLRNTTSLLGRLIRISAQAILAPTWAKVSPDEKAHFEDYLHASATFAEEEEPSWARLCQNIILMLKTNPWKLPHLTKIFEDTDSLAAEPVNSLWEAEGCIFLETRLEKLCQAKAYENAILLAESCVLRGPSERTDDVDCTSPFFLSEKKYYQFAAIFALILHRQEVEDDSDRYFQIKKYLSPSFCLELEKALTSPDNSNRVAPKWKRGWKYAGETAVQCLEVCLLDAVRKESSEPQALRNLFHKWLHLSSKDVTVAKRDELGEQADGSSDPVLLERVINVAAKNDYVYAIADAIMDKFKPSPLARRKCLELYIRALMDDINKLDILKTSESNKDEVTEFSQKLSVYYKNLANYFRDDGQTQFELLLTCFSLNPTHDVMLELNNIAEGKECAGNLPTPYGCLQGRNRVNVCEIVSAVKKAEALLVSLELYEGLLTVMTNPRWARLNCFRETWEEFKPLCVKHLETRGKDIKGVSDLDLVTPDYSKFEDLNPAYDDSDNGYEVGYGPSELDLQLEEEEEERVPTRIREPSHRLKELNRVNQMYQMMQNRAEICNKNSLIYKNRVKQSLMKLAPATKTTNKIYISKECPQPKVISVSQQRGKVKQETMGPYLPPQPARSNKAERTLKPPRVPKEPKPRKKQVVCSPKRPPGRPRTVSLNHSGKPPIPLQEKKSKKVSDALPPSLPMWSESSSSVIIPFILLPFPPAPKEAIFDSNPNPKIPETVSRWMIRSNGDDSPSIFLKNQVISKTTVVNSNDDAELLAAQFTPSLNTWDLINEKKIPNLNEKKLRGVYINTNFSQDLDDWKHWMKFAEWDKRRIVTSFDKKEAERTPVTIPTVPSDLFLSMPQAAHSSQFEGLAHRLSDNTQTNVMCSTDEVRKTNLPSIGLPQFQIVENMNVDPQSDITELIESNGNECLDLSMGGVDKWVESREIPAQISLVTKNLSPVSSVGQNCSEPVNDFNNTEFLLPTENSNCVHSVEIIPIASVDVQNKVSTDIAEVISSTSTTSEMLEELSKTPTVEITTTILEDSPLINFTMSETVEVHRPISEEKHVCCEDVKLSAAVGTTEVTLFSEAPLLHSYDDHFDKPPSDIPVLLPYDPQLESHPVPSGPHLPETESSEPMEVMEVEVHASSPLNSEHNALAGKNEPPPLTSCLDIFDDSPRGNDSFEKHPPVLDMEVVDAHSPLNLFERVDDSRDSYHSASAINVSATPFISSEHVSRDEVLEKLSTSPPRAKEIESTSLVLEGSNNLQTDQNELEIVPKREPESSASAETPTTLTENVSSTGSMELSNVEPVQNDLLNISGTSMSSPDPPKQLVTILSETTGELVAVSKSSVEVQDTPTILDLEEQTQIEGTETECVSLDSATIPLTKMLKAIDFKRVTVSLCRLTDKELRKWKIPLPLATQKPVAGSSRTTRGKRSISQTVVPAATPAMTRNSLKKIHIKIEDLDEEKRRVPLKPTLKNGHVKQDLDLKLDICNELTPSNADLQIKNDKSSVVSTSIIAPFTFTKTLPTRKRSIPPDSSNKSELNQITKKVKLTKRVKSNASRTTKLVKAKNRRQNHGTDSDYESPLDDESDKGSDSDSDFAISCSELVDSESDLEDTDVEILESIIKPAKKPRLSTPLSGWELYNINWQDINTAGNLQQNCDPLALDPLNVSDDRLDPLVVDLVSDSEMDPPTKEPSPPPRPWRMRSPKHEIPTSSSELVDKFVIQNYGEPSNSYLDEKKYMQNLLCDPEEEVNSDSSHSNVLTISTRKDSSRSRSSGRLNVVECVPDVCSILGRRNVQSSDNSSFEYDSEPYDDEEDTHCKSDGEIDPLEFDETEAVDPEEIEINRCARQTEEQSEEIALELLLPNLGSRFSSGEYESVLIGSPKSSSSELKLSKSSSVVEYFPNERKSSPGDQKLKTSVNQTEPSLSIIEPISLEVESAPPHVETLPPKSEEPVPEAESTHSSTDKSGTIVESSTLSIVEAESSVSNIEPPIPKFPEVKSSHSEPELTVPDLELFRIESESSPKDLPAPLELDQEPISSHQETGSISNEVVPSSEINSSEIVDSSEKIETSAQGLKLASPEECVSEIKPDVDEIMLICPQVLETQPEGKFQIDVCEGVQSSLEEVGCSHEVQPIVNEAMEFDLNDIKPLPPSEIEPPCDDLDTMPVLQREARILTDSHVPINNHLVELEIARTTTWSKENNYGSRKSRERKRLRGKLFLLLREKKHSFLSSDDSCPLLEPATSNRSPIENQDWRDDCPPKLDCYEGVV